ncbi:MAG: tetratricopeptide repeat protein [Acidobacteriota bacterium]|nr:tetratricopeptide repeat protein [Acidobacteriota bacterium]
MSRRLWLLLGPVVLTIGLAPFVTAEQSPTVAAARTNAEQSWRAGRLDEIEKFADAFPKDEQLAVLRAKAIAARGDYARADAVLQPFAAANPAGDASLEAGLLHQLVGRRNDARRALQVVMLGQQRSPTARDYLRAARAARALGRFDDANAFFRDADGMAPNDPVINTEWGNLFVEKYNNQDAARSFQEALKADPDYGPALLGLARSVADQNPPQAVGLAQQALKQNPIDPGAHLFVAEMAIYQDKKKDALASIDQVLAVNPRHLEALSMQAALAYVDGRMADYDAAVAAALKIHPTYGEIHRVVGSITAHYYRFDEAVEHVRQGIALDQANPKSYADLGAHLMRTGDERNARRALETAFKVDPWNVVTYNLLQLLDTLEPFDTIHEGDMVIRLHPDEQAVLRQYVPQLAKESMAALTKRWEFTPKGPILVQLFPNHDDFAVRTLGLPGMIGALGACFGQVVTMDSPRARPPGSFNWAETLWHEMAHVITLQLSNNRLPRWLSEGASVYEERRARQEWGREMDIPFARYMDKGKLISLRDLNSGFSSAEQISYSYYQASLVVEHIVDVYGQPKLRALVVAYGDGSDTETAIKKALGVDLDTLQASFDAFLESRYAGVRRALAVPKGLTADTPLEQVKTIASANPDNYTAQMALGEALAASDPDAAMAAFERAAKLVPNVTGGDSPYALIAAVAAKKGDQPRAAAALATLTAMSNTDIASARQLATLVDPARDRSHLQVALKSVVAIDPFDGAAHATLGRLDFEAKRLDDAIRMFRVALAAKPLDRASAHADLGEALAEAGQRDEARKQALAALEVAPTYTRAQDLLLKLAQGSR